MEKRVPFKWEFGDVEVSLWVSQYVQGDRLYIGLIVHDKDGAEPFCDMTVNLPHYPLRKNESFISHEMSTDLLRFIDENNLGVVQPRVGRSGFCEYALVEFNLDRLREFDPRGVENFEKQHDKVTKQRRKGGKERGEAR